MKGLKPDTSVYALQSRAAGVPASRSGNTSTGASPTGGSSPARKRSRSTSALLARIERGYGVDRYLLLALWGVESAYGDPLVQQNHMRPMFPALAALAWGEPRRRAYWEKELLNALIIVERGWSTPARDARLLGRRHGPHPMDARGLAQRRLRLSTATAASRRSADPDDALASTARYLLSARQVSPRRALGLRGDGVTVPCNARGPYAAWQAAGVKRANGEAFPQPKATARLLVPEPGGPSVPDRPEFLRGAQLQSVDELRAGDRASERPAARRRPVRASSFPAASARRRSPRSRKCRSG